ncbi:hypothetical protein [Aporhodopirellula aestuarii]|uniref:Uncharacterized protein n=1 Tax=Aporhodopirellula aestuarii TaxID=2950107 RepID=A0ABT0U687_9BACT|nr:hypothetical protein [Aporhodopirellula aestuarii]MCM2372434.1 hypothetical protein [Aporhodopirellula aestuarii]
MKLDNETPCRKLNDLSQTQHSGEVRPKSLPPYSLRMQTQTIANDPTNDVAI